MDLSAWLRGRLAGLSRAFQRRPEVRPKPVPRHDQDFLVRLARRDLQIPVDGPGIKQRFIFLIDEDRRRRESFQQFLRGEILEIGPVNRSSKRRGERRRQAFFDCADPKTGLAGLPGAEMAVDVLLFADRLEAVLELAQPFRTAPETARLRREERNETARGSGLARRAANRSARSGRKSDRAAKRAGPPGDLGP